jgi:hypothetical protein
MKRALLLALLLSLQVAYAATPPAKPASFNYQIIPLGDGNAILFDKGSGATYRTAPCSLYVQTILEKHNWNTCWQPMFVKRIDDILHDKTAPNPSIKEEE